MINERINVLIKSSKGSLFTGQGFGNRSSDKMKHLICWTEPHQTRFKPLKHRDGVVGTLVLKPDENT